jgi:hypothetical protein
VARLANCRSGEQRPKSPEAFDFTQTEAATVGLARGVVPRHQSIEPAGPAVLGYRARWRARNGVWRAFPSRSKRGVWLGGDSQPSSANWKVRRRRGYEQPDTQRAAGGACGSREASGDE